MFGIQVKLAAPVIVAGLLLIAVPYLMLKPAWISLVYENELAQHDKIIKTMEPDLLRYLLERDYAALYSSLDYQLQNNSNNWLQLVLIASDGRQLYPLEKLKSETWPSDYVFKRDSDFIYDGKPIATLSVVVDWSSNYNAVEQQINRFVGYLVIILIFVLTLLFIIQNHTILLPLKKLIIGTTKIAEGNITYRIPNIKKTDEIGRLGDAFNKMQASLSHSFHQRDSALEQSEYERTRLKTIYNTISDALIVVNVDGFIESFNPAAEEMFGYTKTSVLEKHLDMLIPESLRKTHSEKFERFKNDEKTRLSVNRYVNGLRKNGQTFPLQLSVNRMELGDKVYFIAVIRDVTKEQQSEKELIQAKMKAEEASRSKSEFLAKMSHEIRTPMNGILGLSQALMKTNLDDNQKNFLNTIYASGTSLLSIINDILDFSKVEAGRLELESISFDLYQLTKSIIELFQTDCESKGIECFFSYSEILPRNYIGDPIRVRQIILNLINNAVKFTKQGNITISIEAPTNRADTNQSGFTITVKDTGIGMNNNTLNTLFESFVQADNSTTRKYGGSGLGLAISKQLIVLMGGSVDVASKIDEGTTFHIHLPLKVAPTSETLTQEELIHTQPNIQLEGKVLLVEDVFTNQLVVKSLLEPYNLDIVSEDDGKKAIDRLQNESFDLVLMDCQMPIMDGFEATRFIRKNLSKKIPIIALTADAYKENTQRCYDAGMNDFLSKPFTEDTLLSVIAKWLPQENSFRK